MPQAYKTTDIGQVYSLLQYLRAVIDLTMTTKRRVCFYPKESCGQSVRWTEDEQQANLCRLKATLDVHNIVIYNIMHCKKSINIFNSFDTVQQIIASTFGMKYWRYFKSNANLQREKIVMWEWLFPKREANICSLTTQNGGRLFRCLLLLDQLRLVTLCSWFILCSFHVQPITYTIISFICSFFSIFYLFVLDDQSEPW